MSTQKERAIIDLVINGEQSKSSLKDITAAAVNARKELNRMAETDPGYAKQKRELEALMRAQQQRTVRIKEEMSAWQKWKSEAGTILTGVVGGNIATAGIQALIGFIPQAIDRSMKLKDELADVAKAADMTDEEVIQLRKDLKDMPTRTATKDLMAMAEVGGQFGVAKNELAGFVDGMNKVNVAIGKDFGGVEELTNQIMPLRNIFANIKTQKIDQDILHIGNALNVLEADGAATSPVMADISSRIGGVLVPLGLAEGKVLGLAATLQELNVTAERGSTATVNIFQRMLTETSTFAKVAGMPLKEYRDLINKDMNAAFLAYLGGLKKVSGSQTEFMAVLEKSKLTGSGEMEVLSKLVTNTDLLAKKSDMATAALSGTDSVMAEYNKKNYDLAVNMKKLSDWFNHLMGSMAPLAQFFVTLGVDMLGLGNASDKASHALEQQQLKVNSLWRSTQPLIDRIDVLKAKTKLSKDEQDELSRAVAQVATTIPSAVTQFDKMGRAMDVSTGKARDYIKAQQEILKYTNKLAIEETQKEMAALDKQLKVGVGKRMSAHTYERDMTKMGGVQKMRAMTDDEMRSQDAENARLLAERQAVELRLKGLRGDFLEPDKPAAATAKTKLPVGGGSIDLGESKEEKRDRLTQERADRKRKSEAKAVERHEDSLEHLIEAARQRTSHFEDDEFTKEQLQFGEHYQKLFELAQGDAEKTTLITELMYNELAAIEQKEQKRKTDKAEKDLKEKNKKDYEVALNVAEQNQTDAYGGIERGQAAAPTAIGDADVQQQKLKADELFLTQKLLLEKTFAQESAETQRQLTENWNQQVILRANTEHQYAEQMKQAEYALQDAKRAAMSEGLNVLLSFLGKNTTAYKVAIAGQKAFAIAQVIVDMNREIAQIYANPTWSLLPDGGLTLKTASATAAKVRAGISIASIAAQGIQELTQKDDGGFTGIQDLYGSPSGFVGRTTRVNQGRRSYIVGEKRKEWIMGGAMLENPVMANLAGALEALQQTGGYRNFSASTTAAQGAGGSGGSTGGMSDALLMRLIAETQAQRSAMEAYANRPILNNYRLFEQYQDQVQQIRNDTKL